jgi:hypothetical protein
MAKPAAGGGGGGEGNQHVNNKIIKTEKNMKRNVAGGRHLAENQHAQP